MILASLRHGSVASWMSLLLRDCRSTLVTGLRRELKGRFVTYSPKRCAATLSPSRHGTWGSRMAVDLAHNVARVAGLAVAGLLSQMASTIVLCTGVRMSRFAIG